MSSHPKLPALLVIGFFAMSAQAQQEPTTVGKPSVIKDCAGLKGQALRECQKVARQMEDSASSPQQTETTTAPTTTDANDLHHSSPVMMTKEERVVTDARQKGKDPQKALQKLKKDSDAKAEPSQKSPQ
jgi:hypothetical protein